MEDMRMVKFETLVKDVNKRIIEKHWLNANDRISLSIADAKEHHVPYRNNEMELLFDYKKLNKLGKKVLKNSQTAFDGAFSKPRETFVQYLECDENTNPAIRIGIGVMGRGNLQQRADYENREMIDHLKAARYMINEYQGHRTSYNFIFWALFILAVDKTDYEEKLSLICDFAKMLHISDEEILDIVKVIKYIFRAETGLKFSSNSIPDFFENVLKMYE